MDVRLTGEQQQLRNAAAKLADDLGPGSVAELADAARIERLDRQLAGTGWCALRSDGASGVEVAIVAEEFGRGLVDAPFAGPVLADEAYRLAGLDPAAGLTVVVGGETFDARGAGVAVAVDGSRVLAGSVGDSVAGADLTRTRATATQLAEVGAIDGDAAGRRAAPDPCLILVVSPRRPAPPGHRSRLHRSPAMRVATVRRRAHRERNLPQDRPWKPSS